MSRIHWDHEECAALAKATAEGLLEAKINTVPSAVGNANFLKPIINQAMKKALLPNRIRPLSPSIRPVVQRWWGLVPKELERLQVDSSKNGHAEPAEPPPPPPPPPPEKQITDFSTPEIVNVFFERILQALGTRQTIVIPGFDEIRAGVEELRGKAEARAQQVESLHAKVSDMENRLLMMKNDLAKFKPPPPQVFCLGAQPDTQKFLLNKCSEGRLEVDFRFMDAGAGPRPVKADYAIFFGNVSHDWQQQVSVAVPKSHTLYVGGRHDAAMIQLREWLK